MTADRPPDRPPAGRVVLVVGAASRDVVPDDSRGWRLGGAVNFASLALARLGFDVHSLVGVDAEAAKAPELDLLRSAGAVVTLAELASGPVFDNTRHICLATSDRIPTTALPRRWTSGFDALVLTPVAAEIGDDWAAIAGPEAPPLVALGWQGLLRELVAGSHVRPIRPVASALARRADLVVMSRDDLASGLGPDDLLEVLGPCASLVVTASEAGGTIYRGARPALRGAMGPSTYPAIPSDGMVDPTGAGDVFLAAMVATLLQPSLADGIDDPTTFAAAAASLAVEAPGLLGVADLASVRRRAARAESRASRRPSDASSPGAGRPSQA